MKTQKTIEDVKSILSHVKYKKDWTFSVEPGAGGFLLKVTTPLSDRFDSIANQYGKTISIREWYISSWSTDTEVVRTAYKAVMYVEEFLLSCTTFLDENKLTDLLSDDSEGIAESLYALSQSFRYKDWTLKIEERHDGYMMQIVFVAPDNENPNETEEQHCRKFFFRKDATFDDAFFTLIHAVQSAEQHECDEQFSYKGQTIYNPHMDMDALVDFMSESTLDRRL